MNTSAEATFHSKHSAHTANALRFITCGSVDDGKSTLIGRLLVDSKAVLQDHLAGVTRSGATDLALLTDGLSAEREQGITIDVAYRYFSTEARKFIIGDAPGHEQYTRNMVTAASSADAAVVLVDATKLDWANPALPLLTQTRRHSLLLKLLRVPSIVFAVNKLDAVTDPALAFAHIQAALSGFAQAAGIHAVATVPVSALLGWNVVDAAPEQADGTAGWCGYTGPTLLEILEALPTTDSPTDAPFAFPVQWVEKLTPALAAQLAAMPVNGANSTNADTATAGSAAASAASTAAGVGRRVFWGRVAAGSIAQGDEVQVFPSGQKAFVAQVLDHARRAKPIEAGTSAGIVLDREVDVSRGDWLLAAPVANTNVAADDDFGDTPAAVSPYPGL
ncbi:MAG: hypothetical protein K2W33_10470, partial [Burkholderiales bacterium]|nr:hypothetical protein [Burkholderiales bacterium]